MKRYKTEVHAREVCITAKARAASTPREEESLGDASMGRQRSSRAQVLETDLPF